MEAKVPEKFLEAILVDLRKAGLVSSARGTIGGHRLARDASEIMIGDVIRVIDGPLAPLRCASVSAYKPCTDCPDPGSCSLRLLMGDVREAMSGVLDRCSLAEFIRSTEPASAEPAGHS
ncbi:hypothetical protein P873_04640 [Arenimonas composti TR7-09 = DSM 18010]|uniref:Rrf2 family transcriptional regulator n=1 Tax=Arenimonas composti TR7-09 = DSM 18010 TaxID=1121013 RepID=A0A091BHL4_9GAMM|nr:hypothetical protein P873_04640 [Arenimonas composti TR7-09 = DSM 18010]